MNKIWTISLLLAAASFVIICVTGIDLINSRTGVGLLGLGLAGLILSVLSLINPRSDARAGLIALVFLGGGYFIWRAYSAGPASLALADTVLVLLGLGVYFAVSSTNMKTRWIWIVLLFGLATLNTGIALYQRFSSEVFYFWQDRSGDAQLIGGLFGHYNAFASFLNGSIFFLLSYLFLGKKTWVRAAFGIVSVGMLVALVLSGSRGGWLSFVVGGVVWMSVLWVYLKQRGSKMVGVAALLVVVFAVGGGLTSSLVLDKLTQSRVVVENPEQELDINLADSDGGRFAFQQMAFEVFQDSPLIGQGPRAFSYRSLEKWDPDSLWLSGALPVFAHNEYLQALSDYGLVGFLIIIVLLFSHGIFGVAGILISSSKDHDLLIWKIGAIGGLAAVLCQSFFSFLFHFPACMALVAFQLGILATRSASVSKPVMKSRLGGRVVGLFGAGMAVGLVMLGFPLAQAYLLNRKGVEQFASAKSQEEILAAFDTLEEAGNKSVDPDVFEVVAQQAMAYANGAKARGDLESARVFNLRAKVALERSLELNPYFGEGIAGLPRIEDALGNYAEAERGHQKAMKALWTRENSFRPHYQAARSSYFKAFRAKDDEEVLVFLYEAERRMDRRLEIFGRSWEYSPMREFRAELDAWIDFYEARLLFVKGDDIWKNVRPRNPELAYALLEAAQKRFQRSEKIVRKKDIRWERDSKQLATHLKFLQAGRVQPISLSEEEIIKILAPQAGLASGAANR